MPKSAESIFIIESVLLNNVQLENKLIVELITAPLWSLKKAVVSETQPPKLILTGDFYLAIIFLSDLKGIVSLVTNLTNLFLLSKTGINLIS